MTSPVKPQAEFDVGEFFRTHQRRILMGVAGIAVVGVVGWFWRASAKLKATRAEQAYTSAERSYYSGNLQLAEANLAKVVQRYGGTNGGVRATMLLARALYQQNKPDSGIRWLRSALGKGGSAPFKAPLHGLIAAGLENTGKFDSAAVSYAEASRAARTQIDREIYLADQARSLTSAGKRAEALKIWQTIAARDASPLMAEARLRIGELSAVPAKGG